MRPEFLFFRVIILLLYFGEAVIDEGFYSYFFLQSAHVLVTVGEVDRRIGVENLNS